MNMYYQEFYEYLEAEDRGRCIEFVLSKLTEKHLDIVNLYEDILKPALNKIECCSEEKHIGIWKEHIRSSIIRSVIECCYPYVIKEMNENQSTVSNPENVQKIAIICPDGEYHELGARMVSDFFTLCGFKSVFIGGSTPKGEFISVIDYLDLKYIAISVTNHYNLVAAKRTIHQIREKCKASIKILVGGYAFSNIPEMYKEVGADIYLDTFEDIQKLVEGGL